MASLCHLPDRLLKRLRLPPKQLLQERRYIRRLPPPYTLPRRRPQHWPNLSPSIIQRRSNLRLIRILLNGDLSDLEVLADGVTDDGDCFSEGIAFRSRKEDGRVEEWLECGIVDVVERHEEDFGGCFAQFVSFGP